MEFKKTSGPYINKIAPLRSALGIITTDLRKQMERWAAFLHKLHRLLLQCWVEGTVPQEISDVNTITLYKTKVDRGNYRGISLLCILRKAFARLSWRDCRHLRSIYTLRHSADSLLEDPQLTWSSSWGSYRRKVGSRDGRNTSHSWTLPRPFNSATEDWMSPKLLGISTTFHGDMQGTVQNDWSSLDPFPITGEMKLCAQFNSIRHVSLATAKSEGGMYLHIRGDSSLFNLVCLLAQTKVQQVLIREMLFANDVAPSAHSKNYDALATRQLLRPCV